MVIKLSMNMNNSSMDKIKQRLKEEIENSGLTKAEIACRVGVSPEMITQYITTKKLPRLDTFARLCKELDISANYILGLDE
jgi:DNA-binding helix-turn-helix protein